MSQNIIKTVIDYEVEHELKKYQLDKRSLNYINKQLEADIAKCEAEKDYIGSYRIANIFQDNRNIVSILPLLKVCKTYKNKIANIELEKAIYNVIERFVDDGTTYEASVLLNDSSNGFMELYKAYKKYEEAITSRLYNSVSICECVIVNIYASLSEEDKAEVPNIFEDLGIESSIDVNRMSNTIPVIQLDELTNEIKSVINGSYDNGKRFNLAVKVISYAMLNGFTLNELRQVAVGICAKAGNDLNNNLYSEMIDTGVNKFDYVVENISFEKILADVLDENKKINMSDEVLKKLKNMNNIKESQVKMLCSVEYVATMMLDSGRFNHLIQNNVEPSVIGAMVSTIIQSAVIGYGSRYLKSNDELFKFIYASVFQIILQTTDTVSVLDMLTPDMVSLVEPIYEKLNKKIENFKSENVTTYM